MSAFREYTGRVTLDKDGAYCWRQEVDREYVMRGLKHGFIACIFIAVFILVYGVILSLKFRDPGGFLPVIISVAVFMVIVIAAFGLTARFTDSPCEVYTMRDTFLIQGTGKSSVYFEYKGAKKVTLTARYIELKGRIKCMRVYVPEEDMSFVKNYIMGKVPGDAEIIYKQ